MVIDRNCWHARLWRWHQAQKGYNPSGSVNLCPYVRAVLFWAPARFIFLHRVMRWITWPSLALSAEYGLWRLSGILVFQVELAFLTILAAAAAAIGIGIGIWALGAKASEAQPVRSFGQVVAHRYSKVHEGICPIVHIR